jgi:hypothetical protein
VAKSQPLPIKVTLCDISASQMRCSAFLCDDTLLRIYDW